MASVGAKIRVSGMVQGVGYRYFCYQKAISFGLVGWVRNDADGTVTAGIEGERALIESLIEVLEAGPPASSVSEVAVQWVEFTGSFQSFDITHP
jgi:acylphosphatase